MTLVEIGAVRLKVRPHRTTQQDGGTVLMCSVDSVEQGHDDWVALHYIHWNQLPTASVAQPAP
jgi:hypothetical protein